MIENFLNKITEGDCLELLSRLPDNSVDVTFADPPFNLSKRYGRHKDDLEMEEYLAWCSLWLQELVRVTKPTGSIFVHNIPQRLTYYSSCLNSIADFKHWISWDAPTAPMGKSLQPSHYGILFYAKDASKNRFYELRYPHKRCRKCGYLLKDYGGKKASLHPFGPLVSDVWTDIHRIKHNKYRDNHPCQLPIHLLERIILMSTGAGDVVLDPFMGTGTTAIAAKRLGRSYIGFEIDKSYIDTAVGKLSQERPDSSVGGIWVSFFRKKLVTIRNIDWGELSSHFEFPECNKMVDYVEVTLKK